jgi:heavy metal efflux system protein
MMKNIVVSIMIFATVSVHAQIAMTCDQAIAEALKNNEKIKASTYDLEARKQMRNAVFDIPKTEVTMLYGEYNSYAADNSFTVTQSIPFSAFGSQQALNRALIQSSNLQRSVTENDIIFQVKQVYFRLAFAKARHLLLLRQDSIFQEFVRSASHRYKTGETNMLEQTTAETQRNEALIQIQQNKLEISGLRSQLKTLTHSVDSPDISSSPLEPISFTAPIDSTAYASNPSLVFLKQQANIAEKEKKLQVAKAAPDLLIGFFSQTLTGAANVETGQLATSSERFTGIHLGLSIPLWFGPHHARIRAAEFNTRAAESNFHYYQESLQNQIDQAIRQSITYKGNLDTYLNFSLKNADLILKQAQTAFKEGEIGYTEYLLGIRNAINIKENYFRALNDYNQNIIYIEYLIGKK